MDHNSPIVSVKKLIIDFLKAKQELQHADIRESYIKVDTDLPLKKPLITISKGKSLSNSIGFSDYLGENFDEVNSEIVETRGKELTIYYDFHIWNATSPKLGGEKEIERIQERLLSIFEFESNAIDGITFFSFEEGTAMKDTETDDLFHSRCILTIKTLWKREFRYEFMNEIETHGEIE